MLAVPVGTMTTSAIAQSTPFVLGTSAEPSSATASRSARASALNAASARWWSLLPLSTSTCSVMRAVIASEAKKCVDVLGGDVADPLAPEAEVDMSRRPAGEVDHDARQRLVERRVGVAEAADAAPVAERLVDGRAQRQRAVLGRVVVVDVEIALAVELEVEPAVLGQRGQHVVEEAEAGLDRGLPLAVEVELDA